jgi:hypothetical protein
LNIAVITGVVLMLVVGSRNLRFKMDTFTVSFRRVVPPTENDLDLSCASCPGDGMLTAEVIFDLLLESSYLLTG